MPFYKIWCTRFNLSVSFMSIRNDSYSQNVDRDVLGYRTIRKRGRWGWEVRVCSQRLTIGLKTLFLWGAGCPPDPPLPPPPAGVWWLEGGVDTLCGCRGSSRGVGGNGRDGGCGSGTTEVNFSECNIRSYFVVLVKIPFRNAKLTYKSVRYSRSRGWSRFRHLPLRSTSRFFLGGRLRRHVLRQSPTLLDLLEITTQRVATGCLNYRRRLARQCRFVIFVLAAAVSIVVSFCNEQWIWQWYNLK